MKRYIIVIFAALLLCSACGKNNPSTDAGGVAPDKIIVQWCGRFPPKSTDDDTEIYTRETAFFSDGRVEYTARSYNQTVLESDSWQADSGKFSELADILNSAGFFSLPDTFIYGAFDEAADTLTVQTGDTVISSTFAPSDGGEEDTESYSILTVCCAAFREKTEKP